VGSLLLNLGYINNKDDRYIVEYDETSYKITDKNNINYQDKVILDKITPGDIMYLQTGDGAGWHSAIVLDVTSSNNISLSDIKLIESTWYNYLDGVFTKANVVSLERSLNDYKDNSWVVVRLKENKE